MRSLFLFLFVSLCISVQSQSLIKNGGFEDQLNHWETWINTPEYAASFSVSNENPASGNACLKSEVTNVDEQYWAFKFANIRIKQSGFSVNKYDILTLTFKARGEGNKLIVQAGLAKNAPEKSNFWDLEDYDFSNFEISEEWQTYTINFLAPDTTNNVQLVFRTGEKTGTYFIDDITLEVRGSTYETRNWMHEAEARIDTLRKADFQLVITDSTGQIIPNAEIQAELLSHDFQWGTSFRSLTPSIWNSTSRNWEKTEILKTFNTVVHEDDFKWHQMEKVQGSVTYENVDMVIDWTLENDFTMRGHCLFWPKKGVYNPEWFETLSPEAAKEAIYERISREMTRYKGRITEYDVVNEPVHNPFLSDWLGDTIYHFIFTTARNTDPDATLVVNEWWNFDYWDNFRFRNFVETELSRGTPIDELGLQAHLDKPVDWMQFKFKLDYLAETGLPLKLTEFDMDVARLGLTLEEQASSYATMMRLAFSHPAFTGFIIWGLRDGWRDDAAIYHDNLQPRPAADTMHYLIKKHWHTNTSGSTDENGKFNFNGFTGTYQIRVTHPALEQYYTAELTKKSVTDTLVLPVNITNINPEILHVNAENGFSIFPNPARQNISIKIIEPEKHYTLFECISENGQLVSSMKVMPGQDSLNIRLETFDPGIYYVRGWFRDGMDILRFVVQK